MSLKLPTDPRLSPDLEPVSLATAEEGFLAGLGRRVRGFRNRRGMTRKMLAAEADVSERHLAQLETGDGNISVLLLQRIATALSVSIGELFMDAHVADRETAAILKRLERLPAARRREIVARIQSDIEDDGKARDGRIALIGLRGAGKSTLGARLAADLNVPFIELDREIEQDAGVDLAGIFSLYGQAGYRRFENRALERVLATHGRAVISVGGGVVSERETYDRLLASCFTVWVKAKPEEHMARVVAQGDLRAMEENDEAMEDLRDILAAREPLYGMADFQLETSGDSVDESFSKLKRAASAR
ncbi:MAG: helix-turn-helix transcriptional regulator [Candidatus Acidiferrales bacterium]|jgi:XRE family transcriptional regulator, aerobic/anaerobic benzoate catabolism transcriptional regulator